MRNKKKRKCRQPKPMPNQRKPARGGIRKPPLLCNELGLTMTAAVNIFAKAMVRRQGIPFEISLDVPNAETLAAIVWLYCTFLITIYQILLIMSINIISFGKRSFPH